MSKKRFLGTENNLTYTVMNTMRSFRILALLLLMIGGVSVPRELNAQPGVSISFQTFYNELSPYGRWVRNPQFGSVWVPDVPRGFQPYSTNGYWEVTEYGNTWVSDYDWGWAPFHYGRWSFDDYIGWFWVPDYEWGPAWVNWRTGGGYYGWAPLGPGVNVNVSINVPSFWWVFVPQRYITHRRWHNYCPPPRRVTHVYNQTVVINNYYRSNNRTYVYGPRREEIARVTRRDVPIRTIDASPSGRGRVIAGNATPRSERGDYNYDRRGSVVDASRGGRDYNNDRNDNRRVIGAEDNSRNNRYEPNPGRTADRREDPRIERRDNSGFENRDNNRSERNRGAERSPFDGRDERTEPSRQPERTREYNTPRQAPERSSRQSRSNESFNPGRGSAEAPQRQQRMERASSPESRGSRAPQDNAGRGASERSSRGPR